MRQLRPLLFLDYDGSHADLLILRYRTSRQICALAAGPILGAGDYYDEPISIDHASGVHQGAETCEFKTRFSS